MITLRGMTWNHPRGVDPLVAHSRAYESAHDVRIEWEARSLEDFEAFPLDELAAKYDLMVIDHPHVGMAAASGCLLPLDAVGRDVELYAFAGQTVGGSHETYHYKGHQWALAIDAATQVAARRAGSMSIWPTSFDEVIALAKEGRVLCPLAPVHAMMCFFTLSANVGQPCHASGDILIEFDAGIATLERIASLAQHVPVECFAMNPIHVFEKMIEEERFIYSPLIYGYVSYARDGFRKSWIEFGNIAGIEPGNVRGSALGGTGIAVSAASMHRDIAVAIAFDLASASAQKTLYAESGGQPAHREAWNDERVNHDTHDFYRNTISTLDGAYVRPRFGGYIAFQAQAGAIVQDAVRGKHGAASAVDRINQLFREAQSR